MFANVAGWVVIFRVCGIDMDMDKLLLHSGQSIRGGFILVLMWCWVVVSL